MEFKAVVISSLLDVDFFNWKENVGTLLQILFANERVFL